MAKRILLCTLLASLVPVAAGLAQPGNVKKLDKLCSKGDASACWSLGSVYQTGLGVPADAARAVPLFRRACAGGERNGCKSLHQLGEAADKGEHREEAAAFYASACDGGWGLSCTRLAYLVREGRGDAADPARAAELLRQGCAGGSRNGCKELGDLLLAGDTLPRDPAASLDFYERACRAEQRGACAEAGRLTLGAEGLLRDPARSAAALEVGCATTDGIGDACWRLGLLFLAGDGVASDATRAFELFRHGCYLARVQSADACHELATSYRDGRGVEADVNAAREYFSRACGQRVVESCQELCRIECEHGAQPLACKRRAAADWPIGQRSCSM